MIRGRLIYIEAISRVEAITSRFAGESLIFFWHLL